MAAGRGRYGFVLAVAVLFVVLNGGGVWAESLSASYIEDQKIDESLGLLGRPWDLDLVNVNSRLDQLLQVRPGFPPFDQQVERAQAVPEPPPCVPQINQPC